MSTSAYCPRCTNKVTTPHTICNCPYIHIKQSESIQNPFNILVTNGKYDNIEPLEYINIDQQLFGYYTGKYGHTIHISGSDLTRAEIIHLITKSKNKLLQLVQTEPIDGIQIGLSGHGALSLEGYNLFISTEFHSQYNRNAHVSVDEILDVFRDPTHPEIASLPKIGIFDFCRDFDNNNQIKSNYEPQIIDIKYKQNELLLYSCTRGNTSAIRATGSVMWKSLFNKRDAAIQNPQPLQSLFTACANEISNDINATQTVQGHSTCNRIWYLVPSYINFKMTKWHYTPDLTITFGPSQINIKSNDPGRTDLSYYLLKCNGKTHTLANNRFLNHGETLTILYGINRSYLQNKLFESNQNGNSVEIWMEDILRENYVNELLVYNPYNIKIYEKNIKWFNVVDNIDMNNNNHNVNNCNRNSNT
eukprot:126442_1